MQPLNPRISLKTDPLMSDLKLMAGIMSCHVRGERDGEPRERVPVGDILLGSSHFPLSAKCFVPIPAIKMTPHRHTGVVIDYSDKCTCLFKIGESGAWKTQPVRHLHA
jgi:hypothetical protein